MKRIHWHWTAGAPGVNPKEADSYNYIISWPNGEVVKGVPVDRQRSPLVNGAYAAHTLNANSDAIGIAIDAMAEANERPFVKGKYPITPKQLESMIELTATLAEKYGIPVSRKTTLSHAEVETTLGIKQRAKWDIMWIPGMMEPGSAISVGDVMRGMVRNKMRGFDAPTQLPEKKVDGGIVAAIVGIIAAIGAAIAALWDKVF